MEKAGLGKHGSIGHKMSLQFRSNGGVPFVARFDHVCRCRQREDPSASADSIPEARDEGRLAATRYTKATHCRANTPSSGALRMPKDPKVG